MAYIPKSKLKKSTTLGGEFITKNEKQNYVGDYIETSTGKFYAGHKNTDLSIQLIKTKLEDGIEKPQSYEKNVVKYNIFKKGINKFLSQTKVPPTNKQKPTEEDYERGYYSRYFCKKINDQIYIELNKEIYSDLRSKSKKYDYNLYTPGTITWHLKGNVFKLNTINIIKKSKTFPHIAYLFPLLNEFLIPEPSIQEYLWTNGKELFYANGDEYIGGYHIHPSVGPMVGNTHTGVEHKKLYYMSQLPKPNGMNYEDWLATQPLPPSPTNQKTKKWIPYHNNPRYFSSLFSDKYALNEIIYQSSMNKFFDPHNNIIIQWDNTDYFTNELWTKMQMEIIFFDKDIKKFYYYYIPTDKLDLLNDKGMASEGKTRTSNTGRGSTSTSDIVGSGY